MLADKILDTVHGEWFSAALLSGASHSNPHELAAHAKLLLATAPPGIRSPASLSAPPAPDAPAAAAFLTSPPRSPHAPSPTDTWTVDTTVPADSAPKEVFYVLRRFREGANRPYRTETSLACPYRGPGPANPCRICRGTDHFARTCPSNRLAKPTAPTAALLASPTTTDDNIPRPPSPPSVAPATGPPAADPVDYDNVWLLPEHPISAVYSAPEADISTAIADVGTPGDNFGDSWLRRHPQVATSPLKPATTRDALGHDVPPFLCHLSLRIITSDTTGRSVSSDLPDVHIFRHVAVPLLLCLKTHQRLTMIVDAARNTVILGRARRPVLRNVQRGQLTLPPPPAPPTSSSFYTQSELSLAHRQFGNTSVDALLRAFPPTTFTPTDVATLREVARSCVPCQQFAHLPQRPRHALPHRLLTFNRIIALDTFQLRADLDKVLDINCLHADFGQGRLVPSMHRSHNFALLYQTWLSVWDCPDTILTDCCTEAGNDAFNHALHSMGVHCRPIPTEAPGGVGRNKRNHGPIRDVYIRITAETPDLAPDLALAMACKARNDAPRAHGSSPTAAVSGEAPRLLISENHHFDPAIAASHRAMKTTSATMESYKAGDRLRSALSHPDTTVPLFELGHALWFHRDRQGWLRGTAHPLDSQTVYVRHSGRLFSSHDSRTKPFVSRHTPPSPAPPSRPAFASPAPIRTQTPAPLAPSALPATSRVYLAPASDPASPSHRRWDCVKATELSVFNSIDCKTSLPSSLVRANKQIFQYLWRVARKTNRGNGKPA